LASLTYFKILRGVAHPTVVSARTLHKVPLAPDRFILKFEDILEIGPNALAKVISSKAIDLRIFAQATHE
jgi:hypothetical protein